jgi:hypothetical protein
MLEWQLVFGVVNPAMQREVELVSQICCADEVIMEVKLHDKPIRATSAVCRIIEGHSWQYILLVIVFITVDCPIHCMNRDTTPEMPTFD